MDRLNREGNIIHIPPLPPQKNQLYCEIPAFNTPDCTLFKSWTIKHNELSFTGILHRPLLSDETAVQPEREEAEADPAAPWTRQRDRGVIFYRTIRSKERPNVCLIRLAQVIPQCHRKRNKSLPRDGRKRIYIKICIFLQNSVFSCWLFLRFSYLWCFIPVLKCSHHLNICQVTAVLTLVRGRDSLVKNSPKWSLKLNHLNVESSALD